MSQADFDTGQRFAVADVRHQTQVGYGQLGLGLDYSGKGVVDSLLGFSGSI